jgi:glyoxylase-like metal-dependent hydrolase (beta-lactamase superfamily II)
MVVRLPMLLFSILAATRPAIAQRAAPSTTYDVYGVRFAGYRGFPVAELVLGADTTRRADLAFIVWVLKPAGSLAAGGGRTVLFDAGFYREKFLAQWKPLDFMKPSEAVGRVGVRPEDVTDIIISHIHWDHVDGADLFPRARVWLQREEYDHYVGPNGEPRARGIDTVDAQMLARLRRAGRIRLIDGDAQTVVTGITAYVGGRHTYASEYITVQTARGPVVLASDNVYMYENLAKNVPIAATVTPADSLSNRLAQDRMLHLAADPRFILPGHDPAIFERFPTPGGGVALIQ